MKPPASSLVALAIVAVLAIAGEAFYLLSTPYSLTHLRRVPTHVHSFGYVENCQIRTTERGFDICMGLPLHTAKILRSGPYYSRSLGRP